jgi:SAM-dependent methyltransferase
MEIYEPGWPEVVITVAAGVLAPGIYRKYAERLDLRGDERVLDFGSGAGTMARYLARRLTQGGRLTCVDVSRMWLDVARRRLRRYPNVSFCLGDIATLDILDASQDVVLIHFVLHDIPAARRPEVVRHLAWTMAFGGRLYIREPLRFIAVDEIKALMTVAGLREITARQSQVPTQGTLYEGEWQK